MSSLCPPLSVLSLNVPLTQLQHSSWGLGKALRLRMHYLGPNAALSFCSSREELCLYYLCARQRGHGGS